MSDQNSGDPTNKNVQQVDCSQRAERRRIIKTAIATLPVLITFTAGSASAQAQGGGGSGPSGPS